MKDKVMALLIAMAVSNSFAQKVQIVNWTWFSKKTGDRTYEVHLRAAIKSGWHIYAMQQPKGSISSPVRVTFGKNPMVTVNGNMWEDGKLEKKIDDNIGTEQWQYSNTVTLVQAIRLKGDISTSISGTIRYQACSDEMCLPQASQQFTIKL